MVCDRKDDPWSSGGMPGHIDHRVRIWCSPMTAMFSFSVTTVKHSNYYREAARRDAQSEASMEVQFIIWVHLMFSLTAINNCTNNHQKTCNRGSIHSIR